MISRDVTALLVTHNATATLAACVASVRRSGLTDIVVVDNASTDTTCALARSLGTTPHPLARNIGFSAAMNEAARLTQKPYLLLLNPDATLTLGALALVYQFITASPRVGMVGLLLCDVAGHPEASAFGPLVTPWTLLTRKLRVPSLPTQPTPVGWVSAGAALLRRTAWDEVGGFDERYFLYWEDVDLGWRLHRLGWSVVLHPSARAYHQRGASLPDQDRKTHHYDQSADTYWRTHYPYPIWLGERLLRSLYRLVSPRVR